MAPSTPTLKRQLLRLSLATVVALLVLGSLLNSVWTKKASSKVIPTKMLSDLNRSTLRSTDARVAAQNQIPSPSPVFLRLSDADPSQVSPAQANSADAASLAANQVYIGFDRFPSGALVGNLTPIFDQYPPAVFSSDPLHYPLADNQFWNTSSPNLLGRAHRFGFYDGTGYAPLYVDFTTPVNDLTFYIAAVDEFRQGIAQLNIFQNHRLTATKSLDGFGRVFQPSRVDVAAMGFNNVTRIEIVNINDYKGVGFDDFTFTIAPTPSPTPTPQPTPPPPSGLTATVTDRQVRLNWAASATAAGYYVKRSASSGGQYTTLAAPQNPSYLDPTPAGDTTYFYVVSAFNNGGESPNSNQVSASIPTACGNQTGITQSPGHISSISGWDMTVEVSANDGVVVKDVSLNGRSLARSISIPYFNVATSKTQGSLRGELKPNSNDANLRSRLVKLIAQNVDDAFAGGGIIIQAEYVIDRISLTSDSCLHVTQFYSFFGKQLTKLFNGGRSCEPSGVVPCEMYQPDVSYKFESRNDELLLSFNATQRNEFWVNGIPVNGIGVFRDCDSLTSNCQLRLDPDTGQTSAFRRAENPLMTELKARVIDRGQDSGNWDNIHQTYNSYVAEPGIGAPDPSKKFYVLSGGCPECMHMHWRWGAAAELPGLDYGHGNIGFYYPGTDQDMDIGIAKYKPLEQENTEPQSYKDIINGESIRLGYGVGDRVLVYYSATGRRQEDVFFRHLYFYNPDFGASTKQLQRQPAAVANSSTPAAQDGPISVTFPHLYKDGAVSFEEFNHSAVGPLPSGYAPFNNLGYNISTDAEVSGPYVVSFGAASVTDQSFFNSLRILHAEPDPLDPDHGIWVDRTILLPDAPAPDFNGKMLSAKTDNLAGFIIASLVSPQPPNTGSADLSVNVSISSNLVVAPNTLSYTITVSDGGPNTGTETGLIDDLSSDVEFVSVSPSQGSCKFADGKVYCKLGSLNNGSSALVTVMTKPNEGQDRFPDEGKLILNAASVTANESDPNKDNNTVVSSSTALRDPNAPPTVSLTTPTNGARYVGPANIALSASASDDGSIANVDFYDGTTLIGGAAPAGSNQYTFNWSNVSYGNHLLSAVATDNVGRRKTSNQANVLVNGPATIEITSPAIGSVIAPHSNLVIAANATNPAGVIAGVDFFANATLIGTVSGGGQCTFNWNDVPNGKYTITAVARDGSGVKSTSMPIDILVSYRPTVTITSPQDGASFGASPVFTVTANAQDDDSNIEKLTFYANETLLGTGLRTGFNEFTFTWRNAPDGLFSLTAVAVDQYGLTTTSRGITLAINAAVSRPGEFIWFDDLPPAGATTGAVGDGNWDVVTSNPAPFSGSSAHQSRSLGELDAPNGFHQHLFEGATATLPVNAGDSLFTYVFLDPNDSPREIMFEWKDPSGWEHRAYWGENIINLGTNGTNSRRYWGSLPPAGQWVRLAIPASFVGLEGSTLTGMAFSLVGGRASFDLTGKTTSNATPPPTTPPGDFIWVDDGPPAGATLENHNDQWLWLPPHQCGSQSHRSYFTVNQGTGQFRSHSFRGATDTMTINPGDILFTWVFLDGNNLPDELMLQWNDGASFEHRAFWGENFIGQREQAMGIQGTESQRFMGGLPVANQWVRLEVPASYVGLEGKTVSGMSFGFYSNKDHAGINWDCSGKAGRSTLTRQQPWSAISGIWRLYSTNYGYSYNTNDLGEPEHTPQKKDVFFVPTSQVAGAVPMHRFRKGNEYFYAQCRTCYNDWQYDGIAFYVFPDATTPGTVPLYLYHDLHSKYFLTIDPNEAVGMTFDGPNPWAYVYAEGVPAAPNFDPSFYPNCGRLTWRDNSGNERGFRVDRWDDATFRWIQEATLGANSTFNDAQCPRPWNTYRVRAYSASGSSPGSLACTGCDTSGGSPPEETAPSVVITAPADGALLDGSFAITANAFDLQGNGTIQRVEFFANNNKIGEVSTAPHIFVWNNPAPGTYNLVAKATDGPGAVTASMPVTITVFNIAPTVSITSPTNGALFTAPSNITITASASDSDGNVSKVEFFQGSTKLGEATSPPYNFVWNGVTVGSYVLTAVATDNSGQSATSSPVSVVVNDPPNISITTSEPESIPSPPANIMIYCDAYDTDGSITKIELFQGTTLLGTASTSSFNFQWSNVGSGTYTVTAKATDDRGAVTTSNAVTVIVNAPPTVTVTTPSSNSSYFAPAAFTMTATASDVDGSITRIDLYEGQGMLRTCFNTSSCTANVTGLPVGNYVLTAKASDNRSARSTSAAIPVLVTTNTLAIRKIAFASNREGKSQIYSMNTDATSQSRLTNNFANDEVPKWSPDNSKLVFQSDRDYQGSSEEAVVIPAEIYTMKWDGTLQTRLTNNTYDDSAPVWSPDGTKIAFQSIRNGVNYQIYVMNADGSGQVNISNSTANDRHPAWSPDGTRIAFASDRDHVGFSNIYVMNTNGINQTRVTSSGIGTQDDEPAWSPDGTRLAFTSTRDSVVVTWQETDDDGVVLNRSALQVNKEIYVTNSDGSNPLRLTNTLENDDSPGWSNDGISIVFRSDRERECYDPMQQIWIMNADGSNQVDLSNNGFGDHCPSWSHY